MATEPTDTETLQNRREMIFLYDTVYDVPNGNPHTDENRPRMDNRNDDAIVSAYRIKRVIRDYIDRQGNHILIKKALNSSGDRADKGDRYEALLDDIEKLVEEGKSEREAFLEVANDTRIFGDSMASKAFNFDASSITGPVQFNHATSMNAAESVAMGQTSTVAADSDGDGGDGGNMFTDYRIPYALFNAHAVVDEHRATNSLMRETDQELIREGLWEGTRIVTNTSTKNGHEPRLLIEVEYDGDYHIGDLHNDLSLQLAEGVREEKAMRDITDAYIDVTDLVNVLAARSDNLETITIQYHRRLQTAYDGEMGDGTVLVDALEAELPDDVIVDVITG